MISFFYSIQPKSTKETGGFEVEVVAINNLVTDVWSSSLDSDEANATYHLDLRPLEPVMYGESSASSQSSSQSSTSSSGHSPKTADTVYLTVN